MPEKMKSNITDSVSNAPAENFSSDTSQNFSSNVGEHTNNKIICNCKQVSLETIKSAVANGAKSVEDIKAKTGAGTGCGGCVGALQDIIDGKIK